MKFQSIEPISKPNFLLSAIAVAVCGVVGAQGVSAEVVSKKELRQLEEIMVTARRKSESLQDVPVAVSAFGAEQIKERGIETEADLQASTPGLMVRVTNSSNQLNYSLRGQTVDSFSNSQPAVLAYVNEVQTNGVSASSFFDMESIQVLKGPQGTLFGRNATGGAVLYQTKRPDQDFGGYVKVGLGNYGNQEVEAAINVPLTDTLAMRLSGLTRERDGWQKNLYNGDDLASIDTDNIRFSLSYTGDKLENHFSAYFGDHGGKTEGLRLSSAYNVGDTNPKTGVPVGDQLFATFLYPSAGDSIQTLFDPNYQGVFAQGANLTFLNPLLPAVSSVATDNPRLVQLAQQYGFTGFADYLAVAQALAYDEVLNNESNESEIEHRLFTNTTTFEINDSATLKNIIGYNKNESYQVTDVDGSPFMVLKMGDENNTGPFGNGYQYNFEQLSNEIQLSGEIMSGKLSYIVGAYYYKEEYENNIPLKFIADYDTDPFGPAFTYHSVVDDTSKSVFAQATYALTDSLNFTAGARQTWEEVCITHQSDSAYFGILAQEEFCDKTKEPSWLVSLDYRINDEHMVYVTSRASWRTGGYNNTSINVTPAGLVPDSFKQEQAMDVEIGWKFAGMLGDVPSRINVAAYQQIVEDVQRTVYLDVTSITGNVEEAEVKGIEIEAQFDLTEWLQVGAAYAFTDAEYTKPFGDVAGYNFAFGPYADAPENTYSVYFRTETELDGIGLLSFRGDYYHSDDTYYSNLNDSIGPGTDLPEYNLANFRLSLDDIGGSSFSANAYLRNAFDEEYERGGLPLAGVHGSNATIAGEPRTYGMELTYTF